MTSDILLFITSITLFMAICLVWGFKNLPNERWQIFATIPLIKDETGSWRGLNLTYYGILSATAYAFSMSIMVILLGSCHIPLSVQMRHIVPIMVVAIPASRLVAWLVEKKSSTFTVGGATFTAIMILPWVVIGINSISHFKVPIFCFFAAISISYTYGEALGRLACISFGCCYGKPLSQSGRLINRLFSRFHFVFHGKTRKVAYASNLEGEPMVPIQAITSILYTAAALAGTLLFLSGHFKSAMLVTIVITQIWRVISEFFRADYRGELSFSAYQVMAITAVAYMTLLSMLLPQDNRALYSAVNGALYSMDMDSSIDNKTSYQGDNQVMHKSINTVKTTFMPDILQGLRQLWRPEVVLSLQFFWLITFLYTGRSSVTASQISFHVVKDKI